MKTGLDWTFLWGFETWHWFRQDWCLKLNWLKKLDRDLPQKSLKTLHWPHQLDSNIRGPNKGSNLLSWVFFFLPLYNPVCPSAPSSVSFTDEEFQPIPICKFSIDVWLFPPSTLSPPRLLSSLFIREASAHFLSLPKAFSATTHSSPVRLSTLTSLAGVWKPDLPPFLYAGNYWQSTL